MRTSTRPDYRAILAVYDRREDDIKYILYREKKRELFSEEDSRRNEQTYDKERAMMAKRRAIIESWIQEDIEEDL